ncbi:trigger factor [Paramuribaculum intestinale]|uniref:Trigger factor n=3 Tax=Paramuribaculum intestinale TaxID=2094151 RepID=A0A2V1IX76_9BACT|nr:trigger factor [Paramuribaculum intestinale]PWB09963.1 trigger factor [Paramuribaculum intestinale]ROS94152.1 trigger factor [Muribaculaceae bacterium Isolate-043 (Harlan)]
MNVTMQKTDAVSARLTVNVEENDYKDTVVKKLKEIGRTHQIPGFRKGHVAIADLHRRFGADVTSDVINHDVFEAVMKYIDDNKLNVLGQPVPVEVKALDFKKEKDFTFEYDMALAPELDVKIDKDEHIPYYTIEVTDEMVDEQDKAFRKRFGAQVPGEEFEDDALVKGAIEQLDENGNVIEGEGAIQVTNGIVAPMYFKSDDQKDLFKGAKVGDKITFNPWMTCNGDPTEMSSMLQVDKAKVADLHNDFRFTISEIIVVRPAELNQEFFDQVFGKDKVSDEAGYRNAIREMIAGELKQNSEMVFRMSARKYFLEKYGSMELPAAILKKWLIMRNEGLNDSNIDEEYGRMEPDLKWQLVKENIAQKLEVKIEESDLIDMAKGIAARQFAQYGMTNIDDETLTNYAKNILADKNYRPRLVEQCGDFKLFQSIENGVTLDCETVSLDKFKEIASTI